jgi:alpha-beta hydrolase superfamily lysophospholipase
VCVIVHGLGEHAARYRALAEHLVQRRWAVIAYDQQGHGHSPGRRGTARSYDSLLEDIHSAHQLGVELWGALPQILWGHSMGGNLAASFVLRWHHRFRGLVLTAPMLLPLPPPKRDQIFAAWLTGKLIPFWRFRVATDPSKLTHDPAAIETLRTDPLVHNRLSLRLGTQLLAQGRWSLDHAAGIEIPMLVLHGTDDQLSDIRASQSLCARCGENAQLIQLDGMYHDLLHELDRQHVYRLVDEWFEPHFAADSQETR